MNNGPSQISLNEYTISILDYLEAIIHYRHMIAKVTIISAISSVIFSLCLPNIFSATSKILPPQQDSYGLMGMMMGSAGGMGSMAADLLGKSTPADMYASILSSDAISDKIIDRFKLMEVYDMKYRVDTYKVLDKRVDISAGKKDGIISITVNDKDPKRASEIANAYVDELDKLTTNMNIAGAGQNRLFYETHLAKAKINLTKAEDNLKAFQSKNKSFDIAEQAKGTIKGVASLEAQLALEEVKLAGLKQVLTDSAQEVKTQQSVVSNIKNQIAKLEGNRQNTSILGIDSVPELGQQYLRLMRVFKTQEMIVDLLTKQYEISKITESKESTSIQIIQTARVPDKKIKPKRAFIVLITTFATGLFSILYAFFLEARKRMPDEERERWQRINDILPTLPIIRKRNP